LTSSEVQARLAALGAGVPSNKNKAGLDAFLNSRPPPDNTPFVRGIDYAEPEMAVFTANFGGVNAAYQTAIDRILADRATPPIHCSRNSRERRVEVGARPKVPRSLRPARPDPARLALRQILFSPP
jgi:hypothetical protein